MALATFFLNVSLNSRIPSISVCCPNRLRLMHVVKPMSVFVKKNFVFDCYMNRNCFGYNFNSVSGDLYQKYHKDLAVNTKFKSHHRKTKADAVDGEEDIRPKTTTSLRSTTWSRLFQKFCKTIVGAIVCSMVVLCFLTFQQFYTSQPMEVPYSDLFYGVIDNDVTEVLFVEDSQRIYFNKKSFGDQNVQTTQTNSLPRRLSRATNTVFSKWQYNTRNIGDDKDELLRMLEGKGITYVSESLVSLFMKNFSLVSRLVLLTYYQFIKQHDLAKLTKRTTSKKPVTFNDVKGVDSAIAELVQIVKHIKGYDKHKKLDVNLPRGVLLTGPPGTGKTLLARAMAAETEVPFFIISASELVGDFIGKEAARVSQLFHEAKKSPSIIFIDGIDAIGSKCGITLGHECNTMLNQLLKEMDALKKDEKKVLVIASTNRPQVLDSSLIKSGRFTKTICVDEPNESGRRDIFGLYLKDIPMKDKKEDICQLVASLTPGLVGADLEYIAQESLLIAARKGGKFVTKDDILKVVDGVRARCLSSC